MQLYRHWIEKHFTEVINGEPNPIRVFGYSNISVEDAERCATTLAATVFDRIKNWSVRSGSRDWDYAAGHPIREEILEELSPRNIVTRNRYGSEVLNSETHCFVDVDFLSPRFGSSLLRWLRKEKPLTKEEYTLKTIFTASSNPFLKDFPTRVYQTKNGYRLIVQNCGFAPDSRACKKLMKILHADNLYSLLCSKQQCFRARLTPKPYRIKMPKQRFSYPIADDPEEEAARREWVATYRKRTKDHAVCHYRDTFNGSPTEDDIIRFHDEATGAFSTKPLA